MNKFRIVSSTPNINSAISTSTSIISIEFNKVIKDNNYIGSLDGKNVNLVNEIKVHDKNILIYIYSLDEDQTYEFRLHNIRSNKDEQIDSIPIKFTTKYIPFNDLSKEQKNLEMSIEDKGNVDDPILKYLPYEGDHYYLNSENTQDSDGEPILVIKGDVYITRDEVVEDRSQVMKRYEQKIKDYLISKDLDPSNYIIDYEIMEPPINQEE